MARGFGTADKANKDAARVVEAALTTEDMVALSASKDARVRELLATRTDLPMGVVITLAQDDKSSVRREIAANAAVARVPSVIESLGRDRDDAVASAIVHNTAVSNDAVEVIASYRRGAVRADALRRLGRGDEGFAMEIENARHGGWSEEEEFTVSIEEPKASKRR
jgi:hypothetical protein